MQIERISGLAPQEFIHRYVKENRPVVVVDAMESWNLTSRWTPASLGQRFGDQEVQIYNDYFDFSDIMTLSEYFAEYFDRPGIRKTDSVPYVRWYTKLRDVEFIWSDGVFDQLRDDWSPPYFVPKTDYILPYAPGAQTANPTTDYFPAKGLFISGQGARTGLHFDPWGSDAVLCQLYGSKSWVLFSPDQAGFLQRGDRVVDIDSPDHAAFPDFERASPTYAFTIAPGETVYVPHGWFHSVQTLTDSISLTWNFVHSSTRAAFLSWLGGAVSALDADMLRFFFAKKLGQGCSIEQIRQCITRGWVDQ